LHNFAFVNVALGLDVGIVTTHIGAIVVNTVGSVGVDTSVLLMVMCQSDIMSLSAVVNESGYLPARVIPTLGNYCFTDS
jgi:hypothetical protein